MKTLSVIVTCYGKDNSIVKRTFEELLFLEHYKKDIDVIFVYNNSDKYNYDWVNELNSSNYVKIIKTENKTQKLAKFIKGLEVSNSKYVLSFDADDLIVKNDVAKTISFLQQTNSDIVITETHISKSESIDNVKVSMLDVEKNKGRSFFNWNTILKLDIAKKASSSLSDEILFGIDMGICWYSLLYSDTIVNCKSGFTKYIRYEDSVSSKKQRSSTGAIESLLLMINQFNTSKNLKYKNKKNKKLVRTIVWYEYMNLLDKYITNGKNDIYKKINDSLEKNQIIGFWRKVISKTLFITVRRIPYLRKTIAYFQ